MSSGTDLVSAGRPVNFQVDYEQHISITVGLGGHA
jgi:hypothetical protein